MGKFLNVIFPKIFATFVITILGHAAFTSVPLWAGLFLVIPGFSLFLFFFLNGDVQFSSLTYSKNQPLSIHRTAYKTESYISNHNLRGYGSLKERQRHLGF